MTSARSAPAPPWTKIDWHGHRRTLDQDGRALHLVDLGDGPAVVLIHGLGGSWQTWLANLAALSEDHRVVALDLRGFGASDPLPAGAPFSAHAGAVAQAMEQLAISDATVVAHSMGGLVACELTAQRPDLVAALALVDAGGIDLGATRLRLIVAAFTLFNALFTLPGVASAVARRPRLRRALLRAMVRDPANVSPEQAHEMLPLLASPGFVAALRGGAQAANAVDPARLTVPTAVIWGERDPVLPLSAARQLAASLPDGRLTVIDGVGHCPMFEAPERFDAALGAFLRRG